MHGLELSPGPLPACSDGYQHAFCALSHYSSSANSNPSEGNISDRIRTLVFFPLQPPPKAQHNPAHTQIHQRLGWLFNYFCSHLCNKSKARRILFFFFSTSHRWTPVPSADTQITQWKKWPSAASALWKGSHATSWDTTITPQHTSSVPEATSRLQRSR